MMFLPSILLCLVLLYLPNPVSSEIAPDTLPPASNIQGQMIVITDSGLEPRDITISREERVAFFVNNSKESLITIEVDFGKNTTHCASKNLEITEDGKVRSIKPVAPKDFATTCFHESGRYPFTVNGIQGQADGVRGTITVQ